MNNVRVLGVAESINLSATEDTTAGYGPLGVSSGVISLAGARVSEQNDEFLQAADSRLGEAWRALDYTWRVELGNDLSLTSGGPLRADGRTSDPDILCDRDLPELLRALSVTGGKRIRPSMCFWGWVATGGRHTDQREQSQEWIVTVAAALEMLHIFALIHDDVMDESSSRRGQPSVHTLVSQLHLHSRALGHAGRFGESIAVLVGDLAHAEADHLVTTLPEPMRRIWRLLVIELVHGQSRDIIGTAAGRRDLGHARQVARMKSGSYTVLRPLQLGAAASQASEAAVTALSHYGNELGEAFALRDDLLGVWGDPGKTGKPAGDDLLSGKPTVILSLGDRALHGSARRVLARVGTPDLSPADVATLQDALIACGVQQAVEGRIASHVDSALAALSHPEIALDGAAGLSQMARRIAWRDH